MSASHIKLPTGLVLRSPMVNRMPPLGTGLSNFKESVWAELNIADLWSDEN